MAEQKQDVGGLSAAIDYSKLPLFGASEKQLESLRDAQQQAITALEQRYAQPNLFKVSEAFLKPQLGGFAASLGSAMGAMGENTEQQRAQQLPISQMRAQLAQSNLVLGSSVSINEEIKKWMSEHQGQTPPASLVMEWNAKAPQNPTVQSLVGQQKMTMDQQAQQVQTLNALYASGAIKKEEYGRRLLEIQQAQSPQGTRATITPAEKTPVATIPNPEPVVDSTSKKADSHRENIATIEAEIALQTKNKNFAAVERLNTILAEEKAALSTIPAATAPEKKAMKTPSYEELGATGESATKLTEKQLDAINTRYAPIADSIAYFDPQKTDDTYNRLARLANLLKTDGVKKGTGLLYQDQGIGAALQQMISQGFQASAGAAGMGANFSVALPIESGKTKLQLDPIQQKQLREFQQLLGLEGRNDLSAATKAVGGGHMNMAEFQNAMNSVLSSSDPYGVLAKYIAVRLLENERNAKIYDAFGEYQTNPKTAALPTAYFFHLKDSPYKTILDEYKKKINKARAD